MGCGVPTIPVVAQSPVRNAATRTRLYFKNLMSVLKQTCAKNGSSSQSRLRFAAGSAGSDGGKQLAKPCSRLCRFRCALLAICGVRTTSEGRLSFWLERSGENEKRFDTGAFSHPGENGAQNFCLLPFFSGIAACMRMHAFVFSWWLLCAPDACLYAWTGFGSHDGCRHGDCQRRNGQGCHL